MPSLKARPNRRVLLAGFLLVAAAPLLTTACSMTSPATDLKAGLAVGLGYVSMYGAIELLDTKRFGNRFFHEAKSSWYITWGRLKVAIQTPSNLRLA